MSVGQTNFKISKDTISVAASFLNPTDSGSLSQVNKECQEAAEAALKSHSETIRSSARNTYLGRMALMHPVGRVNGKEMPLVRAVIENLEANQHLLQPEDWAALGIQGPPPAPLTRPFLNLSIKELNLAGEAVEQRKKELSLVTAFTKILEKIPADQHPPLEGTLSQKVQTIRAWMAANQLLLDGILDLDLSSLGLSFVPEELMRLTNLVILQLGSNQITHLPENFNLPNLTHLFLYETAITHLPANFNPLNLTILALDSTPITRLPENFNPPNLTWLSLKNTAITKLPENFNPPNLKELYISYAAITELPPNLTLQNMSWRQWCDLRVQVTVNQVKSIGETILGLTSLYLSA